MEQLLTEVFTVSIESLEYVIKEIKKVSKKCEKYLKKAPTYTLSEPYYKEYRVYDNESMNYKKFTLNVVDITLNYEVIQYINEEISVIAKIEKIASEEKVIDRYNNDYSYEELAALPLECQHCNTKKARKYIYVLKKQDKIITIGKTCLKDYTEIVDIGQKISLYDAFRKLSQQINEVVIGYGNISNMLNHLVVDTRYFLNILINITKEKGVITYGEDNTLNLIKKYVLYGGVIPEIIDYSEDVEKILDFYKKGKFYNDFQEKLQHFLSNDYLRPKDFPILIYAYSVYLNALPKEKVKKEKGELYERVKQSQYVGQKKEKIEINDMLVMNVKTIESYYGITFMYEMLSPDNNVFVWFASKKQDLEAGDIIKTILGTVKNHTCFNEIKQTLLTRCKFFKKEIEL